MTSRREGRLAGDDVRGVGGSATDADWLELVSQSGKKDTFR